MGTSEKLAEREILEKTVEAVKEFNADSVNNAYSVLSLFTEITEYNQTENRELWDELRTALKNNKQFQKKHAAEFFGKSKNYINEGAWWFNPAEWG